jgi:hypothetical protein
MAEIALGHHLVVALRVIGVFLLVSNSPALNKCSGRAEVKQIVDDQRIVNIQSHRISFNVWRNDCESPDLTTTASVKYVYKLRRKSDGGVETSVTSIAMKIIQGREQNPVVIDDTFSVDERRYEPKVIDTLILEVSFR